MAALVELDESCYSCWMSRSRRYHSVGGDGWLNVHCGKQQHASLPRSYVVILDESFGTDSMPRPPYGLIVAFLSVLPSCAAAFPVPLDPNSVISTYGQAVYLSARSSVDGIFDDSSRGWAVGNSNPPPEETLSATAVFPTVSAVAGSESVRVSFTLDFHDPGSIPAPQHLLGHFRLSFTEDVSPGLAGSWRKLMPISMAATDNGTAFSIIADKEVLVSGTLLDFDTPIPHSGICISRNFRCGVKAPVKRSPEKQLGGNSLARRRHNNYVPCERPTA